MNFQIILLLFAPFLFMKVILSFADKRKLPPSPLALPFMGHIYLLKKPLHHTLARISQHYGPATFLRFGSRPILVISSRSLAEQCFTTHDLAFANRPHLPSAKDVTFNYTELGVANYGPYWRNIRRIAAVELLSAQSLLATSDVRAGEVHAMACQLFKSWKTSCGSMDLNGWNKLELKTSLFQLSLNILMTMMAGKRFYGDNIEDLEKTRWFRKAVKEHFALSGASNVEDFIPILKLLDLRGVMKKRAELAKINEEMSRNLIEEHRTRDGTETSKTMIAVLLKLHKKDPQMYNDQTIQAMCMGLLKAGTDTTANAVEWAMSHILNNPEVLVKATAEIDKHVGNERLMEESDMANLPYLNCIVSEVLRLYPGGPLLAPHESREDITVGGYSISRGTILLVNAYYIHRDPDVWEKPTKFKPERFENGKAEGKWMIPFGMGRRRCPGEGLAMREVGLILGTLIHCYDWRRTGHELVDLTEGSGLTIPKATPLEAMYQPREIMVKLLSGL